MKKILDTTSTKLTRAVQKTNEAFGRADKTSYDDDYIALVNQAEALYETSKRILDAIEGWINPNQSRKLEDVANRMENLVSEQKLYRLKVPGKLPIDFLGDTLVSAAMDIGPNTPYGEALKKYGESGRQQASIENQRNGMLETKTLTVLFHFVTVEWAELGNERSKLEGARLDYDNLRYKCRNPENESPETLASLERAKETFEQQLSITRQKLQSILCARRTNLTALKEMASAQVRYHTDCKAKSEELVRQLEAINL